MILDNYNPFKKHLLQDKRHRDVYYDYHTKIAYYITDTDMRKYKLYSNRWLFAVSFAVLAGGWFLQPPVAIAVGCVIFVALDIVFRKKFLPSLTRKENVNVEDLVFENTNKVKKETTGRTLIRIILYVAFSVLLVLNAYDQKMQVNNIIIFYMSWALAFASLCVAIYDTYNTFIKK